MGASSAVRKPLGVRVTPEQHRLLKDAAEREHRSVASFVLNAALHQAQSTQPPHQRTREEVEAAIRRAQEMMKKLVPPGRSLVDEVIAERRAEAARGE